MEFSRCLSTKKSEEFFSAIAQLSPDILSLMDEKGTIIFNSSAAERIHGYRSEELVGRNTFELIHEEDRGRVFDAMNRLLRDEIIDSIQYRYLNKDQTWSWMEATGSNQIHNPLIQGLVVVSREVGKRKKLEDDLSQALKERDEFFTIASHELRNPITSIKMQLQMLQRYKSKLKSDDDIERKYEDIDRLMEQIQSVQRLIDDILSVSRIRTGQLSYEIEVINFSDLLKNTLKNFSEIFLEAGCSLDVQIEEGVLISGDKTRLNQVFFNLMNNAVKYSPGKLIKISLNQKSDIAEFRIQDNGNGIPADKIDRIFGLFERGDRKEIISGLGIGLYISRNIVETHKGTIQVESELGKGATFIVQIPTA